MSKVARLSNARFATILAVALALLMSGVAAGAAGQALIIGAANQAGVSNTSLDTTSSGFAWQMFQHGTGVGVFAISENGVALAGLAHNGNQHALSVTNDGAAGTGAALIADGKNNTAADLRVNSNAIPPLKVNSTAKVTNLNADRLDGLDSTAFLPADDYTVMQLGPWHVNALSPAVTIEYGVSFNEVVSAAAGGRRVQLALDGPAAVGAIGYGFESARICFQASSNVTIDTTIVVQATDTGFFNLANDGTDRPMGTSACYTVSDSPPRIATGGTTVLLFLEYAAATTARLGSVTTTWTPVSP